MSRPIRFLLSALILALAPILLIQGLANASEPSDPKGPFPQWNAFWLAEMSSAMLQVEQTATGIDVRVLDTGIEMARESFAAEPLATNALFVLAVDRRAEGDLDAMQAILNGADALDKRNRHIGALRLEQAALSGELQRTFAVVNRLATTHPSLTSDFVRPLVAALNETDAVPILQDALDRKPVWGRHFWTAVPRDQAILLKMYELRQLTDSGTTLETDARMLAALAAVGLYDEAFDFWPHVSDESADFGFVANSSFPPFGWQVTTTGDRAMSARGDGRFEIYVQNDTAGELARQLVRLEPGEYVFSARITPLSDAEKITARLDCVEEEDPEGAGEPLDDPAVLRASNSCSIYWLVLNGDAWDRRNPLRVDISQMRFSPEG